MSVDSSHGMGEFSLCFDRSRGENEPQSTGDISVKGQPVVRSSEYDRDCELEWVRENDHSGQNGILVSKPSGHSEGVDGKSGEGVDCPRSGGWRDGGEPADQLFPHLNSPTLDPPSQALPQSKLSYLTCTTPNYLPLDTIQPKPPHSALPAPNFLAYETTPSTHPSHLPPTVHKADFVKVLMVSRQDREQGEWMVGLVGESLPGQPMLLHWPTGRVMDGDSTTAAVREVRRSSGIEVSQEDLDFLGIETRQLQGQEVTVAAFLLILDNRPDIRSWDPSFSRLSPRDLGRRQRRGKWVTVTTFGSYVGSKHKILRFHDTGQGFGSVLPALSNQRLKEPRARSRRSKAPHFCYSTSDLKAWRSSKREGLKSPLLSPAATRARAHPRSPSPVPSQPLESGDERKERMRVETEMRRQDRDERKRRRLRSQEIREAEPMSFKEAVLHLKHYVADRVKIQPWDETHKALRLQVIRAGAIGGHLESRLYLSLYREHMASGRDDRPIATNIADLGFCFVCRPFHCNSRDTLCHNHCRTCLGLLVTPTHVHTHVPHCICPLDDDGVVVNAVPIDAVDVWETQYHQCLAESSVKLRRRQRAWIERMKDLPVAEGTGFISRKGPVRFDLSRNEYQGDSSDGGCHETSEQCQLSVEYCGTGQESDSDGDVRHAVVASVLGGSSAEDIGPVTMPACWTHNGGGPRPPSERVGYERGDRNIRDELERLIQDEDFIGEIIDTNLFLDDRQGSCLSENLNANLSFIKMRVSRIPSRRKPPAGRRQLLLTIVQVPTRSAE